MAAHAGSRETATARPRGGAARHRKKLVALGVVAFVAVVGPLAMHAYVGHVTTLVPPEIAPVVLSRSSTPSTVSDPSDPAMASDSSTLARDGVGRDDDVRRAGRGWTTTRGVRLVHLAGSPEEIGAEHATLLREPMITNEGVVWDGFRDIVPFAPARALLFDLGRYRYRNVAAGFPEARLREIAAQARAFAPDPYASHMDTYARMVFLHSLYDIALSFERSPLLGCTGFGLSPSLTSDGHALFARAFDFEAADVFDRDKAVFVVREDQKIPFLSVAWPGFAGVVTGMNAEGVAIAVNGGRAREPVTTGIPVALSLRAALESAHDTEEAVAILAHHPVMVSHLVLVGDARGNFAVIERAPHTEPHVRRSRDPAPIALTNHFEGPLASDARDSRVRATTTTLARRARIDELLREVEPRAASVGRAVEILRDHRCADGEACPLGDRRALDAFIATHGVVFDLTARAAWVSEGPHLSGRFVKIDLAEIVSTKEGAVPKVELDAIPADAVLSDGRYEEGRARAGGPLMGPGARPPSHHNGEGR